MQQLFEAWQTNLRHDQDLWTIRHCRGECGGLSWRNQAYLTSRARQGMFPSETMAWDATRHYVSCADYRRVKAAYRLAFEVWTPVPLNVTMQLPGLASTVALRNIFLLAVEGNIEDGLVLSYQLPACLLTAFLTWFELPAALWI